MNQQKELPKYLYKYFPKTERAECIFKHNELYFRNPNTFNDPFDCKALLTLERDWNQEEYTRFLINLEIDFQKRPLDITEIQSCEERAKVIYTRTIADNSYKNEYNRQINKEIGFFLS